MLPVITILGVALKVDGAAPMAQVIIAPVQQCDTGGFVCVAIRVGGAQLQGGFQRRVAISHNRHPATGQGWRLRQAVVQAAAFQRV
jgi:hypothetical protein